MIVGQKRMMIAALTGGCCFLVGMMCFTLRVWGQTASSSGQEKTRLQLPRPGVWPSPTPTPRPTISSKRTATPTGTMSTTVVKANRVLVSSPLFPKGYNPQTPGQGTASGELSFDGSVAQLCDLLDRSSELWERVNDKQYKSQVVTRYIERYKQQGIVLRKPAESYVRLIDDMLATDRKLLQRPFAEVLKRAAVVEYDFGNGENPDAMVRKLFGEKFFQQNKKRFKQPGY